MENLLKMKEYADLEVQYKLNVIDVCEESSLSYCLKKKDCAIVQELPLLDPPVITEIKVISPNSVQLSWRVSQLAETNISKYVIRYTQPQDLKPDWIEEVIGSQMLSDCSYTVSNLQEGIHVFQIQAIYGEFPGIMSEISESISTRDVAKECEAALMNLKQIVDDNQYQDFITTLHHSNKELPSSEFNPSENCEIGFLYNIKDNKPEENYQIVKQDFLIIENFSEDSKLKVTTEIGKDSQQSTIFVTYEDCQETVRNENYFSPKTIEETSCAHFVKSQLRGFQAIINLKSVSQNQEILDKVLSIIKGESQIDTSIQDEEISDILISVSGKIPEEEYINETALRQSDISSIQKILTKEFYEKLSEYFSLKVSLSLCNLEYYFSPLFKKLVHFKDSFPHKLDEPLHDIIDSILNGVIKEIKVAVELMKLTDGDYLPHVQLLQKIHHSLILDPDSIRELFLRFNQILQKHKSEFSSLDHYFRQGVSAVFTVNLPIQKLVKQMETLIFPDSFENDKELSENILVKTMEDFFDETCGTVQSKIQEFKTRLINTKSFRHVAVINAKDLKESFDVEFAKNDKSLDPQPPVFDSPQEVMATEMDGDSVLVKWSLYEEARSLATSYQIDYKIYEEEEEDEIGSEREWHSVTIFSPLSPEVKIFNLGAGKYEFRVRAIYYEDIPGEFSEMSQTLTIGDNDQEPSTDFLEETVDLSLEESCFPENDTEILTEKDLNEIHLSLRQNANELHVKQLYLPIDSNKLGFVFDVKDQTVGSLKAIGSSGPHNSPSQKIKTKAVMNWEEWEDKDFCYCEIKMVKLSAKYELKEIYSTKITLNDTPIAHMICSISYGNYISLTISTRKENRQILSELYESLELKKTQLAKHNKIRKIFRTASFKKLVIKLTLLLNRNVGKEELELFHSISGNCGVQQFSKRTLQKPSIENIKKLESLITQSSKQSPFYMEILHVDLETYLEPILSKLQKLTTFKDEVSDPDLLNLINFIQQLVAHKVQITTSQIRRYEDYKSSIEFLQNLYNSFVFKLPEIQNLLKQQVKLKSDCETAFEKCKKKIESERKNEKLTIVFKFGVYSSSLDHLKDLVRECFRNNKNIQMSEHNFVEQLNNDNCNLLAHIRTQEKKILLLKKCNIQTNTQFYCQLELCEKSKSMIEIEVTKNGSPMNQKMALLDGAMDIKASRKAKNSITLDWKPVDNCVRKYRVDYKCVSNENGSDWESVSTNSSNVFQTIDQLSGGEYVFRVQAIYDDIVGVCSEETQPIATRICLAEKIIANLKPVSSEEGHPPVFALPLEEDILDETNKLRSCSYGKQFYNPHKAKTIVLLGGTGSGKTTLINGLVNYTLNVDWTDNFRFQIIDIKKGEEKRLKSMSQTEWITSYQIHHDSGARIKYDLNIIDTPGFGDTRGIKRDMELFKQVKAFLESKILLLHAVCIVIPNSSTRLTQTQRYIFDSILSIFGNDIRKNIFVMVSFSDNPSPPVIDTLMEANVPFSKYFPFNNSALYTNNHTHNQFTEMFWNLGVKSFDDFLNDLSKTQGVSLVLTREVLFDRDCIELSISNMQEKVKEGLCKLEAIRANEKQLQEHENAVKDNEDFIYKVQEPKLKKVPQEDGYHTTTCTICNYTCHFNCEYGNNEDKKKCHVMDENGNCKFCPKKCCWKDHQNYPYFLETLMVEVQREYKEMKEKYGIAKDGVAGLQEMLSKMKSEYDTIQIEVAETINSIRKLVNRLDEIALQPSRMNLTEYIEMLIQSEKHEQKPGYPGRIKEYKKLKERTIMLSEIQSGKEVHDIIKMEK